jgi:hypothetical protein
MYLLYVGQHYDLLVSETSVEAAGSVQQCHFQLADPYIPSIESSMMVLAIDQLRTDGPSVDPKKDCLVLKNHISRVLKTTKQVKSYTHRPGGKRNASEWSMLIDQLHDIFKSQFLRSYEIWQGGRNQSIHEVETPQYGASEQEVPDETPEHDSSEAESPDESEQEISDEIPEHDRSGLESSDETEQEIPDETPEHDSSELEIAASHGVELLPAAEQHEEKLLDEISAVLEDKPMVEQIASLEEEGAEIMASRHEDFIQEHANLEKASQVSGLGDEIAVDATTGEMEADSAPLVPAEKVQEEESADVSAAAAVDQVMSSRILEASQEMAKAKPARYPSAKKAVAATAKSYEQKHHKKQTAIVPKNVKDKSKIRNDIGKTTPWRLEDKLIGLWRKVRRVNVVWKVLASLVAISAIIPYLVLHFNAEGLLVVEKPLKRSKKMQHEAFQQTDPMKPSQYTQRKDFQKLGRNPSSDRSSEMHDARSKPTSKTAGFTGKRMPVARPLRPSQKNAERSLSTDEEKSKVGSGGATPPQAVSANPAHRL